MSNQQVGGLITKSEMQALGAEFFGMMMFVYTGVGTAHMAVRNNPFGVAGAHLSISLAFGLGITCFAYGTAGYSGGHLNPAVTTSLMAIGEIRPLLGLFYIGMQCVGAVLGALMAAFADPYMTGFALNVVNPYGGTTYARAIANQNSDGGPAPSATWYAGGAFQYIQTHTWLQGATAPTLDQGSSQYVGLDPATGAEDYITMMERVGEAEPDLMWGPAFAVEFMGTFMLVMTVCWTAVSKKSIAGNCAPLAIGLSVFFAHLTAIPITNCSINPARSFGAAMVATWLPYHTGTAVDKSDSAQHPRVDDAWKHMAFFWAVPMLGGLCAALLHKFAFVPIEEIMEQDPQPVRTADVEMTDKTEEKATA